MLVFAQAFGKSVPSRKKMIKPGIIPRETLKRQQQQQKEFEIKNDKTQQINDNVNNNNNNHQNNANTNEIKKNENKSFKNDLKISKSKINNKHKHRSKVAKSRKFTMKKQLKSMGYNVDSMSLSKQVKVLTKMNAKGVFYIHKNKTNN